MTVRIFLFAIAAMSLLLPVSPARAANPMLHASKGQVVNASGKNVQLRCVNLSPWLNPEPYLIVPALRALNTSPTELREGLARAAGSRVARKFWQKWEAAFVTEADFKHLAAQGFTCVRLPLNYRRIMTPDGLDADGIAPVDRAVQWGEKYGIYVILDLHAAPGGQNKAATVSDVPSADTTPRFWTGGAEAENQALAVQLWRWLAARYAGARSVGGYDLLNEPVLPHGVKKQALTDFYKAATAAIREADPHHMVILEGDNYAHDFNMLLPPFDDNTMYQFHEYAIFNAAWRNPDRKSLAPFLKLREDTQMPLWLGEFGENTAEWQGKVVALLKAHDIGWAVWPWKRVDLGNGHPVIQTITPPENWVKLAKHAVGAMFSPKPLPEEIQAGMDEMLAAIRTENCTEDAALAKALAGR